MLFNIGGQESAGMGGFRRPMITVVKDMGLVTQVFDDKNLMRFRVSWLLATLVIPLPVRRVGKTRRPVYRSIGEAGFALGHNGNLINTAELAQPTACCRER